MDWGQFKGINNIMTGFVFGAFHGEIMCKSILIFGMAL